MTEISVAVAQELISLQKITIQALQDNIVFLKNHMTTLNKTIQTLQEENKKISQVSKIPLRKTLSESGVHTKTNEKTEVPN